MRPFIIEKCDCGARAIVFEVDFEGALSVLDILECKTPYAALRILSFYDDLCVKEERGVFVVPRKYKTERARIKALYEIHEDIRPCGLPLR